MKLLALSFSCALLCAFSCSKPADAAPTPTPSPAPAPSMMDQAKAKLAGLGDMKAVQETLTKLKTQLAGITDAPSAERAKSELQTLVASLKQQIDAKGGIDKIAADLGTSGDKLLAAARQQLDKLAQNPQVQQAAGPLLQQLKTMLGG